MRKQVFNPYLPSFEYIPDGEPYVFGDRLYVYGSHDKFGGKEYCENDYVCWSAPVNDLSDWKYEGVIYRKSSHPEDKLHRRTCLYAPDVVKGPDGRYYLYYSMNGSSIMSVAVCDTPAGEYTYYGDVVDTEGKPVGYYAGDYMQFDPSIFIDDDGRVYLYSGFAPDADEDGAGRRMPGCHVSELEPDMLTVKSGPRLLIPKEWKIEEGAAYFEAPSMRKINGRYYFVYSAKVTGLFYYYSDYPDRDFIFGGRIHSTSDVGINGHSVEFPAYPLGNIHGGIVELNGQYYIFDHRHTNHCAYNRQGVAEPIYFDENGLIAQVEATSCGLNGGPLEGKGTYPAYIACNLFYEKGIDKANRFACVKQDIADVTDMEDLMKSETEPVGYIHDISDGCVIGYKYFAVNEPLCNITFMLRGHAKGVLAVALAEKGEAVGSLELEIDTDDCWQRVTVPVDISCGKVALFFRYRGEGRFDMQEFELNCVKR